MRLSDRLEDGSAAADDLVVVVPGIMGSTLIRDGHEVWSTSQGAILRAIWRLGRSIKELALPPGLGDDDPKDGVAAGRLLPDFHGLPGLFTVSVGYEALVRRVEAVLRAATSTPPGEAVPNLFAFPYDWRLSNRLNGRRLAAAVGVKLDALRATGGRFSEARVTFVCHSMGGLIARWYVQREGGHSVTRRIITVGTPHRGSLKSLDELVNGVRRGVGPLGRDLTAFGRSLPSAYQLLPEYACIDCAGALTKTVEVSLPRLDPALVADGMRFFDELNAEDNPEARVVPIVGIKQPTRTTARLTRDSITALETYEGADERGVETGPLLSATPRTMAPDDDAVHRVAERHGSLPGNPTILDELEGALTAKRVVRRAARAADVGVRVAEHLRDGEPVVVEATADEPGLPLVAVLRPIDGGSPQSLRMAPGEGPWNRAAFPPPSPGGYTLSVGGAGPTSARVTRVTAPLLVWPQEVGA